MRRNLAGLAGVALALAALGCPAASHAAAEDDAILVAEYLARGDAHWRQKRYQEALDSYREAEKMKPNEPRVLYAVGSAHRVLGNYREALRNFGRVLELAPNDPRNGRVYGQVGYIHRQAGNYATAIEAYQSALKLEPEEWRTLWYLADLHYKTKAYDLCKQYVVKFKQTLAAHDPSLFSVQEWQDMRRWGNRLDQYLRSIEQGDAPR